MQQVVKAVDEQGQQVVAAVRETARNAASGTADFRRFALDRAEMTMGQRVAGHGSSGSTNLSGSCGSRVSTRDPLTHDQVNKIPRTGCFVAVMMFDFEST